MAILTPVLASTEDTFVSILERIKFKESQHFQYQETRYLALLTRPWTANGDMFITPDGLVMVQHEPTSILTTITEKKLEYFDRERDVRRTIRLKQPFSVPGMAPFLQLLYRSKQQGSLDEQYNTSFNLKQERWILALRPSQTNKNKIKSMTLSGSQGKGPDLLKLEYTDGDETEWRLSLIAHGHDAIHRLQKTLDKINEENDFDN